tara:strand:- start:515 stop:1285 length:771 start_codon:yes stop_codon:yes gene_type:complete
MFISGLVSISFRSLDPEKVISMVEESQLEAIEWGGDVHSPHGDTKQAESLRRKCADAGIVLPTYGSYYRAAVKDEKNPEFDAVLDSAAALGVKTIRVWAGNLGSADADEAYRQAVAEDLLNISAKAAKQGISIGLEHHGGTLTDVRESTLALVKAVPDENITFYWQPPIGSGLQENLDMIEALKPRMSHIHVFHWRHVDGKTERLPLSDGVADWARYFDAIADDVERGALLEFARNDSVEQFYQDAAVLRTLLKKD